MSERFESTTNVLENNSLLGMNSFRPESHVAQQSRRDKLRVPQNSQVPHLQDFSANHLVQLPKYQGLNINNPDVFQVRSFRNCDLLCDPTTMFPSQMHNLSTNNTNMLLAHDKNAIMNQESNAADDHEQPSGRAEPLGPNQDSSFANSSSHVVPSNFMPSSKVLSDPQNLCYWKSQQSCDWLSNYVNGSGVGSNHNNNSPLLVGEILPRNGYQQDVQSSFTNQGSEISNQDCQKTYGEMNFSSPLIYQTNLQEVVTSTSMGSQGFEMASLVHQKVRETGHGSWVDGGNELVLLPSYGNQPNASHQVNETTGWMHRPVGGSHQWNGELGFATDKSGGNIEAVVGDSNTTQSLSLSLSSHRPPPELRTPQFAERFGSENTQSRPGICSGSQDLKTNDSNYLFSNQQPCIGYKGCGNSVESVGGSSAYARRCTGPLGPFTGYATILKNSKFLKPAQQLLDEFCSVTAPKLVTTGEMTERGSRDLSVLSDPVNADNEVGRRDVNSGVSSSICSSKTAGEGKVGSGHCQSYHPEFQQKKAKLLYMLEEVCRRYKQYHQQMQMVVSSFETVAGLDAATPYTSLALKTVSKHFRCLKNTIADQLKLIRKALGEDLLSPTSRTSSNKGDPTVPRLRFIDQNLGKQAVVGNSLGFLESQQHVWRPQRGLPERSVAVLRAWLFEHFLHPYPTDTDKHMLATQTGLTRNQVSNWFINARVRVWKPMVEEMHMLETKASSEMDLNSGKKSSIKSDVVDSSRQRFGDQCSDKLMIDAMSEKGQDCPIMTSSSNVEVGQSSEQQWHQEKRSRMECQIPSGMDGGLMGFIPYHQSALEIGGLGSVSLTLGLRHSAESVQHQEHQLRRHFGSQMVHDFVG
ncbi:Homeobox domain [Macleaya cordata]|uniref:Homeobox domain n=1 Tax=Macleaya cordata TaxID=56857 RepID=A0A200R5N9_MACCD|nr:Homeobox domain [Macleaya cordata]